MNVKNTITNIPVVCVDRLAIPFMATRMRPGNWNRRVIETEEVDFGRE